MSDFKPAQVAVESVGCRQFIKVCRIVYSRFHPIDGARRIAIRNDSKSLSECEQLFPIQMMVRNGSHSGLTAKCMNPLISGCVESDAVQDQVCSRTP